MTGRHARNDTFSNLKQKRELNQIFEQVSTAYKQKLNALNKDKHRFVSGDDFEKITLQFILKCLEDRQQELAVHSVTNDNDINALKGLIASGNIKRMLITPKKIM